MLVNFFFYFLSVGGGVFGLVFVVVCFLRVSSYLCEVPHVNCLDLALLIA